ncbi:MAG: acyl-[acyl-carrier-protein] thioesterase [Lachnospiraceae bacterium]|nr:acyl-[acyl-carrier-protein] thioesterase [Lachnospiraceae bacterium]
MYELKTRIRFSETDSSGKLTINGLINYFQDVSTFHSEGTDFGIESLKAENIGWMIFSWDIKINRLPKLCDEVVIQTKSVGFKGLFAFRDFIMKENDEVLAMAHSVWSIIDLDRMLPKKITPEMMEQYGKEDPLPGEWFERKLNEPKEKELVESAKIERYHLDTNGHMNNQYYVDFALSAISDKLDINRVRVSYKHQVVLGENVDIYLGKDDEETKRVTLEKDGTTCAVICFN